MLRRYPLRALAAVLLLIIAAEIWGICHTPNYDAELAQARAEYQAAKAENRALLIALGK